MSWPVGLPLGSVNFGAAVVTQSGVNLPMRVTVDVVLANDAQSKTLVFRPTGQPLVGVTTTFDSDPDTDSHSMALPLCDTPNMGYGNGTTLVLDETHQFTHVYKVTIDYLTPGATKAPIVAMRTVKSFVITTAQPSGDIDDLLLIPSTSNSFGVPVSVPDVWSTQIAAAQQAAAASAASAAAAAQTSNGTVAGFVSGAGATKDAIATAIGTATTVSVKAGTASRKHMGGRTHFHGSSIMHGDDNLSVFGPANSPPTHAMLHSDGRWRHVGNSSVDGSTSAAQLASFAATVLPSRPNVVVLDPIPNDAASGFTNAQTEANVSAMVKIARDNGIGVVICNCPPQAGALDHTSRLNAWLQRYCAREGIPMVDYHGLLIDPNSATGDYRTGENTATGNVHPAYPTRQVMGIALDDMIRTLVGPTKGIVFDSKADPRDVMLGSGLFLGAANSSGSPGLTDGWGDFSGVDGTARTFTTVTDAAVKGKKVRCVAVASTKSAQIFKEFTTGFAVGDLIEFSGLWNTPDTGPLQQAPQALIQFKDSGGTTIGNDATAFAFTSGMLLPVTWGTWATELTVPAGCVKIHVRLRFSSTNGTYISEFAQVGIRNLTAGGIAGL